MHITDVSFEDEDGKEWPLENVLIADEPWTIQLKEFYGKNLTVKNKGHASSAIFFDIGFPFEGKPVIPALDGITEEVLRTVNAFEAFLFGQA